MPQQPDELYEFLKFDFRKIQNSKLRDQNSELSQHRNRNVRIQSFQKFQNFGVLENSRLHRGNPTIRWKPEVYGEDLQQPLLVAVVLRDSQACKAQWFLVWDGNNSGMRKSRSSGCEKEKPHSPRTSEIQKLRVIGEKLSSLAAVCSSRAVGPTL